MNSKLLEVVLLFGILILVAAGFTPVWTQTSAPTNTGYPWIASSADGKIVCAIQSFHPALISTDGGNTWTTNGTLNAAFAIAASADGTKFIMSAWTNSGTYILVSTNTGNTWKQTILPNGNWEAVASSADGARLAAAIYGGYIYISTNSGATWNTNTTLSKNWASLATTADGNQMVAAANGDLIYASTNSGMNWTPTGAPSKAWNSICSSCSGKTLAATADEGTYTSTDHGSTWRTSNLFGQYIACSADGTRLMVAGRQSLIVNAQIWTSTDSGRTWAPNNVPGWCEGVAFSADGCKLVATSSGPNGIWIGQIAPSPQLNVQPANGNFSLSWTVPSTNFVLQQNLDLNTTNWTMLTNLPVLNLTNLQEQVGLSLSNGKSFFRLVAQ